MKGTLYVAGHVDAWRGVLCCPGGLYMGMRPVVKGWSHERIDHHRHHTMLWLSGLCHDPAGAVLSAMAEKQHHD